MEEERVKVEEVGERSEKKQMKVESVHQSVIWGQDFALEEAEEHV